MSIARIQQATSASLVVLWVLMAALAGWAGQHAFWFAAAVLLPVLGYAAFLALEFLLQRSTPNDAQNTIISVARATRADLLRAWWGECVQAPQVFCWRQPFRHQRWPNRLRPSEVEPGRGVLLIHGFFCNRGVWNPWMERLTWQRSAFVAVNLNPPFGSIDDYAACIDQAVHQLKEATGLAPVVVAHSMGGLALRRWWAEQTEAGHIHHAITLGTPHHGTWLARFAFSRNGRQMRPQSPWLRSLEARESARRQHQRMTCYYSNCDNIVFPAAAAALAGADNRHLPGIAHLHMVMSRAPWEELLRRLAEPAREIQPSAAERLKGLVGR